jgi:hypothetical protein
MPRSPKQVAIADHLWEAFARMAEEMGSDRDALVNQAMHVFARLNGYVVPGSLDAPGPPADVAPAAPRQDRVTVAEKVLEAAERLERDIEVSAHPERRASAGGQESKGARPPPVPSARAGALRLVREDGSGLDVAKGRFVIGRGAHCDLVVDSAKISREHAAVVRDGEGWFIEDLGSSNGTWFRGERIARRAIADGDEYFLCSERLTCELR